MSKELLELAAAAANIPGKYRYETASIGHVISTCAVMGDIYDNWNPKVDSEDAFELAVKLGMLVRQNIKRKVARAAVEVTHWYDVDGQEPVILRAEVAHGSDPVAATRQAILELAAAVQRHRTALDAQTNEQPLSMSLWYPEVCD